MREIGRKKVMAIFSEDIIPKLIWNHRERPRKYSVHFITICHEFTHCFDDVSNFCGFEKIPDKSQNNLLIMKFSMAALIKFFVILIFVNLSIYGSTALLSDLGRFSCLSILLTVYRIKKLKKRLRSNKRTVKP
jgi:hypothetical protein